MTRAFTTSLACALLLAATPAQAIFRAHLDYAYYDVEVKPGQRILPAIMRTTTLPPSDRNPAPIGKHIWQLTWNYDRAWGENWTCKVNGTTVDVTATIHLPRLKGGDATQQAAFDKYMVTLKAHEDHHHTIAREAAEALDHALRSLPAARDCNALHTLALARAQYVIDRYNQRQREFDIEEQKRSAEFYPDI